MDGSYLYLTCNVYQYNMATHFSYTVYTTTNPPKKNKKKRCLPFSTNSKNFADPVSTPLQKSKSRLSVQSPSKLITAEKENSGPTSPQLSWWWNGGGDIYPVKISLGMVDVTELGRLVLDSIYIYIYSGWFHVLILSINRWCNWIASSLNENMSTVLGHKRKQWPSKPPICWCYFVPSRCDTQVGTSLGHRRHLRTFALHL